MRGTVNLHNALLDRVLRLPVSFFDTNPSGRIINRFSRDTEIMDSVLPLSLSQARSLSLFTLGLVVFPFRGQRALIIQTIRMVLRAGYHIIAIGIFICTYTSSSGAVKCIASSHSVCLFLLPESQLSTESQPFPSTRMPLFVQQLLLHVRTASQHFDACCHNHSSHPCRWERSRSDTLAF